VRLDAKDKIWVWAGRIVVESGKSGSLVGEMGNKIIFIKPQSLGHCLKDKIFDSLAVQCVLIYNRPANSFRLVHCRIVNSIISHFSNIITRDENKNYSLPLLQN
jgi:hypothetical protein